jgi:hypothetical protein
VIKFGISSKKAYFLSPTFNPSAVTSITSLCPPAVGDIICPTTNLFKEASLSVTTK